MAWRCLTRWKRRAGFLSALGRKPGVVRVDGRWMLTHDLMIALLQVPADASDVPLTDIRIKGVTIHANPLA